MRYLIAAVLLVAACGGGAAASATPAATGSPAAVVTVAPSASVSWSIEPPPVSPTATPTPGPSQYTDAEIQAQLDALRAAGDCDGVLALDATNAGDTVGADHESAVEDCSYGFLYPTAAPAKVVTVKGTGSRNTKPFGLGVADYSVVIKGKGGYSNVAVTLYTVGGTYVDLLVNEISDGGSYQYETVLYGEGCSTKEPCYYLDATMPSGAWTVTFTPLP